MRRRVRYTEEFVRRFRELTLGNQRLVESAISDLIVSDGPEDVSHHLERHPYFCSWSHRLRGNLLIVFKVSKDTITFVSTGTHAQAYRPSSA